MTATIMQEKEFRFRRAKKYAEQIRQNGTEHQPLVETYFDGEDVIIRVEVCKVNAIAIQIIRFIILGKVSEPIYVEPRPVSVTPSANT
ncbi:MAG: hypothetical protein JWN18_125 [Parcubacteria group bacterium]|nr:hypothetical protein [Parcubacteria group bacterium]